MRIVQEEILEKSCKEIIETILECLDCATKGTIYLIGPVPELRAVRVASGVRVEGSDEIRWGLPGNSDYNYPGKTWLQYRDEPGRPLEAMGWCVERQKSWTADNPREDERSVRKQVKGEIEDYHHMEPVLVKKKEIYGTSDDLEYPKRWDGTPIWQNTDYAVVAVIKIHFLPNSIRRGDKSTKLIKRLSKFIGSELLSLYLREVYYMTQRDLEKRKLESCNELADQLRNPIMKLAFVSSAVNAEIAFLREQWEKYIAQSLPHLLTKEKIIERLNEFISTKMAVVDGDQEIKGVLGSLLKSQNEVLAHYPHPEKNSEILNNRILPMWKDLLGRDSLLWGSEKEEINHLLGELRRAIWYGLDEHIRSQINHIPDSVKNEWCRLAYSKFSPDNQEVLEEILDFLERASENVPHGHHVKQVLKYLKLVSEVVRELESKVNSIIENIKSSDVELPSVVTIANGTCNWVKSNTFAK